MLHHIYKSMLAFILGTAAYAVIQGIYDMIITPNHGIISHLMGFASSVIWHLLGYFFPVIITFFISTLILSLIRRHHNWPVIIVFVSHTLVTVIALMFPIVYGYIYNYKYESGLLNAISEWGFSPFSIIASALLVGLFSAIIESKFNQLD